MMVEVKKVPKLRFASFGEAWILKKMSDLFTINAGGDIQGENVSQVRTDTFKYPIYANAEKKKGLYGYSDIYKVDANVLTIAGRGVNIGIAHARNHKFYPIVRLLILRPKSIENIKFFEYQFNRQKIVVESTGVPQLTAPQVSTYCVFRPTLPEQEKIANFLTAVDAKISNLSEEKNLLEQYKKGAMQKIFSQELRFKNDDGSDFPEWENKRLGEVAIKQSSNISANTIEDNEGEFKIYGAAGFLKTIDFYREEQAYISIVKDGAGVGRTLLCEAFSSVLGTLDILKPKTKTNLNFLYYLINSIDFTKYVTGSTIPHIYFRDYSKEKIKIPHIEEQTKIANFLSSIDEKIATITEALEGAQAFKKGLLQQLFV